MSLFRRLNKLEKRTRSKYHVGLFVDTTPDGRCEIKERLCWDYDSTGKYHSERFRTFTIDALEENIRALVDAVNKARPAGTKGIYLRKVAVSSTMGPGVRVDQSSFAQTQQ